ncbi:hypothetical protein Pfo_000732 [Paulownia fortunei]|nr:hypothetical protein Pfo_000732 [Paulownia fortunei]
MSGSANATLVKCAIEDGAFLFMEKPTAVEELKYLWQHVLREKTRKNKGKGICGEASTDNHNQNYHLSRGENLEVDNTAQVMTMNRYVSTNKVTSQKERREHINFDSDNNVPDQCMRPKMCTEWTPELHDKFMAAVKQLGDGKCFPKEILEVMNVPGLTRMQVASHLQKCRHGWQPPHERQGRRPKASKSTDSSNTHRSKTKRYGLFPRLIKGSQPQFPVQDNQNDERGHTATSDNIEHSTPSIGTQNVGQEGTWDTTVSNNSNMNEISSENVYGNMVAAPAQGLQSDASFDFAAVDDGLIANNFDLHEFDYDHTVSGQTSDAANEEPGFWSSWIANFARDI